jgi:polyisoprenoid-binding protein YceI
MVSFSIRHLGVSKVRGRFRTFDAELVVGASPRATSVTAVVELASIDTANAQRDEHVRSAEILDVAQRPQISFRSTAIDGSGSRWHVDGELTIGAITRPLRLEVEFGGVETFVIDGTRHAGFEATGELRRKDFGIAPGGAGALLGDVVKVELDLQFIEPDRGRSSRSMGQGRYASG